MQGALSVTVIFAFVGGFGFLTNVSAILNGCLRLTQPVVETSLYLPLLFVILAVRLSRPLYWPSGYCCAGSSGILTVSLEPYLPPARLRNAGATAVMPPGMTRPSASF